MSHFLKPLLATVLFLSVTSTFFKWAEADPNLQRRATIAPGPSLGASLASDLGFENVLVDSGHPTRVAFENRRLRHSVEAFGLLEQALARPFIAFEQRLGMPAAAISIEGPAEEPRFRVRYPTDAGFPRPPRGQSLAPTSRTVDLVAGPLIAYEIGRVFQPVQFQLQVEPRLRYNPWPGARATASLVIPVYNDFLPSLIHPDLDRLRPGLLTLEQYAWIPRLALASGTVGLFGDNRYGISVGGARPFAGGRFLLDAQADLTGFIAFSGEGTLYSSMSQWSSFAGLTWRVPWFDVSLRARVAQFLFGDQGEEFEFKRTMGDVDFSLFTLRSGGFHTKGVRFTFPVPPMVRSTGAPVRIQPIERFPFGYRTETETIGLFLSGVASREEFLRQLNEPALAANRDRYRLVRGEDGPRDPAGGRNDWVSHGGMTGFINTPWAGVIEDRAIELSYSRIPKEWAYGDRGRHANEPWSLALGLLPRVEVALRFTRIPGKMGFFDDPDNLITTDTDHMASGRLTILTPGPGRPGLAVGIEDVEGTRRFHASYLVAGIPLAILHVQSRLSLGYAPRVFTAARHVLDGSFGAFEVSPWRAVAARIEYDSEKWNAGIGVRLVYGLRLRAAALNMKSVSVGAGWHHQL